MKLFYTGNSPYVRRARSAARESGLGAWFDAMMERPSVAHTKPSV